MPNAPTTLLSSPDALYALVKKVKDPYLVDLLVKTFTTWEQLVSTPSADVAWRVGTWAMQLNLPLSCPPLPFSKEGVYTISRYENIFPAGLLDLQSPPVLLFAVGKIPPGPYLGIGGSHYPSPAGVSAAKAAVKKASELNIPIAAALGTGIGDSAILEALRLHTKIIAVASSPLEDLGPHAGIMESIILAGGMVLSEFGPKALWSEANMFRSNAVVAALAKVVIFPEFGVHPTGGSFIVKEAIRLGRFIIVPKPAPSESTAITAMGVSILASARTFSENYFGSSAHVRERLLKGLSPADDVVANEAELKAALLKGCIA